MTGEGAGDFGEVDAAAALIIAAAAAKERFDEAMKTYREETMTAQNRMPAFPVDCSLPRLSPGMTLRDYFAAHAMQSVIAGLDGVAGRTARKLAETKGTSIAEASAELAYEMADAMLEQRDKP